MNATALITDALLRANEVSADVRKASLFGIARVQTVIAPEQARITLQEGWATSHGLHRDYDPNFEYLTRLATAAVAPERLPELGTPSDHALLRSLSGQIRVMRQHGHIEYLRTFVLHDASLKEVSFDGIQDLIAERDNEEERRLLLRRAVQAWRFQTGNPTRGPWEIGYPFLSLFRNSWKILPRADAAELVEEMIQNVLAKRDEGTYGQVGEASFKSLHALEIFQCYDLLLELAPERAKELLKKTRELARAVKRYPKGLQTMKDEAYASLAEAPPRNPQERAWVMTFSGKEERDYGLALLEAEETRDFSAPLRFASGSYRHDSRSDTRNYAPKAFWPSGAMYKEIFYQMGRVAGESADQHLTKVPDKELRLLAQIELAAGLCGLPELAFTRQRRPRPITR